MTAWKRVFVHVAWSILLLGLPGVASPLDAQQAGDVYKRQAWPYSRSWGYYPSGGLGLVVVILLVLLLSGRL